MTPRLILLALAVLAWAAVIAAAFWFAPLPGP